MRANILFQRVSEGDNILYGGQHRSLKRDLRSELSALGLSSDGLAVFVRLELRREGVALAVGRQGIAGREGDYEAAWALIPPEACESEGGLPRYAQEMRQALGLEREEMEEALQRLEALQVAGDPFPVNYTPSRPDGDVAYRIYKDQEQLASWLQHPAQRAYVGYKAVYLLEHSAHSQPRGGFDLTRTSEIPSVLITPPAQVKRSEGGVASLKLCAADGREWEFKQPMRFPFGESITLEWRHQCSLYQVYKQELTCERNQQLDVPSDDKWEWKFDTSKFEVLINERRKSIQNFEVLINEKPATPTYTRDQLLRDCSVVINCLGYEKVSKTVKEKDLEQGSIEFRLSPISKPAPSPAPGYSQGHLTKRLNMWKVATFALGLVLLLSWGGAGGWYFLSYRNFRNQYGMKGKERKNLKIENDHIKRKYEPIDKILNSEQLHQALGTSVFTKVLLDPYALGLFEALKSNQFEEAIRLSKGVLKPNGELGKLLHECSQLQREGKLDSTQLSKKWADEIKRSEYINYLKGLLPKKFAAASTTQKQSSPRITASKSGAVNGAVKRDRD